MTTTIRCPHCSMHFEYETDAIPKWKVEYKIAELEKYKLTLDTNMTIEAMMMMMMMKELINALKDLLK